MREHEVNELDNFMMGWYIDDISICDKLIDYHKNSPNKKPGAVSGVLSENFKKSTDVILEHGNVSDLYVEQLRKCADEYIKKYTFCNMFNPWTLKYAPQIQHYKPEEGYYAWHSERISTLPTVNNRHLVFMTYLNDVNDGGTEFYYQKITVKAQKGLTLIWPVDWTFTHRGEVSNTQEKYIVTGWFDYVDR